MRCDGGHSVAPAKRRRFLGRTRVFLPDDLSLTFAPRPRYPIRTPTSLPPARRSAPSRPASARSSALPSRYVPAPVRAEFHQTGFPNPREHTRVPVRMKNKDKHPEPYATWMLTSHPSLSATGDPEEAHREDRGPRRRPRRRPPRDQGAPEEGQGCQEGQEVSGILFPTFSVAWLRCRGGDWFTVEHF